MLLTPFLHLTNNIITSPDPLPVRGNAPKRGYGEDGELFPNGNRKLPRQLQLSDSEPILAPVCAFFRYFPSSVFLFLFLIPGSIMIPRSINKPVTRRGFPPLSFTLKNVPGKRGCDGVSGASGGGTFLAPDRKEIAEI